METNSQSMIMKRKLDSLQVLKQALHIPFKNPSFIIFLFFTSLPLLVFTIMYEMIYQQTILETAKILQDGHAQIFGNFCFYCSPIGSIDKLINMVSSRFLLLFLLYLGILHILDLINTIYIIDSASNIYLEEKIMNLNEITARFRDETRFRGPLMTSIYSLFLAWLVLSGMTSVAVYTFVASNYILFVVLFGGVFIALLVKYIEWSAVWNMAAVVSVLDDKEGDVAFVISSYLSRGSRKQGILYSLVFVVWCLASRLAFLYFGWHGGTGIMAATIHAFVLCLGSTVKWLVFTVYYHDCRRGSQEKRIDVVGKMCADEPGLSV